MQKQYRRRQKKAQIMVFDNLKDSLNFINDRIKPKVVIEKVAQCGFTGFKWASLQRFLEKEYND